MISFDYHFLFKRATGLTDSMLNVVVMVILFWLMYRMGGRANIGNGKKNYLGVLHGSKTVRIGWVNERIPNLQIDDRTIVENVYCN